MKILDTKGESLKCFVITVRRADVLKPRLYKMMLEQAPTRSELIRFGADIVSARKDDVTIDAVSGALFNAVRGTWLS